MTAKKIRDFSFYLIIAGIIARVVYFAVSLFVGGNNVDEAMLSVNAQSLAANMTDIAGERLPIYFDTWYGGGQSSFATYFVTLFIKVLGLSLFSVRLPSLILSIISLIFAYFLSKELFSDEKYRAAFCTLSAVSPWLIYTAGFTMDCNYLGHLIIIALYFAAKAINTSKTGYYIASMLFFSLCFYCYIASILMIPFLLAALFIILLIKKRVSVKNAAISFISTCVFSLPFILWGLVVLKVIPEFSFLGFSFSQMPEYSRAGDTVFGAVKGAEIITEIFLNWFKLFILYLTPNYNSFNSWGVNVFQYGNLLSGVFLLIGLIKLALSIKKPDKLTFVFKALTLASFISVMAYFALVYYPRNGTLYRYNILTYVFILIETIGCVELIKLVKKIDYKKVLSVYAAAAVVLYSCCYIFVYMPQVDSSTQISRQISLFGDHFYDCLDFAEENGYKNITISKNDTDYVPYVYSRVYFNGEKDFYTTTEVVSFSKSANAAINIPITKDNSVTYITPENINNCSDDIIILYTDRLDSVKSKEYKVKTFGYYSIIYK